MIATDKAKAWSFSALNNYESCPKKYWELSINKKFKEVEGEAILYGKRVHKAFELLVRDGKALPNEFSHMQKYVQPFIDVDATKLTEQQLCITKDFVPTDWKDWTGGWCRAIIDLALMWDDQALLIDYKTGKMKDDGFTQLKMAAAIFMIHFPKINKVSVAYLWTEHNGHKTTAVFERAELTAVWNELLPRVNEFQRAFRESDYPPRPSGLCRKWCIIDSCPHHGQ
jgi:hypothetical protein